MRACSNFYNLFRDKANVSNNSCAQVAKTKAALKQKHLTKDRLHVAQLDKTRVQDTVERQSDSLLWEHLHY